MDAAKLQAAAPAAPTPSVTKGYDLKEICDRFALEGSFLRAQPHGNGHINDTFAVSCSKGKGEQRYILQRINRNVFRDVDALMENIQRVTGHAGRRLAGETRPSTEPRQVLTLIPTTDRRAYLRDEAGGAWRCYDFVEGARTYDLVETPSQARHAAHAFGAFQELLRDLPGPRLHETIPDFHHTRRRFERLRTAAAKAERGHREAACDEIAFALAREESVDVIVNLHAAGQLPERITHNDTKLNNVMLDDVTGHGVCVIDLDTVMPGLALYDFGDMVRSASNAAAEDESDLSRVSMRLPVFAALVEGYLASARTFLNHHEIANLVFSARLITFEIGLRFLTDFLEKDVYFKVRRPRHNLDRCRCQFALLRSMEDQADEMDRVVDRLAG
jgi:aminoglycoside phosphotransferase (APT) family kinase protein